MVGGGDAGELDASLRLLIIFGKSNDLGHEKILQFFGFPAGGRGCGECGENSDRQPLQQYPEGIRQVQCISSGRL
jgi:hypothetical protein